MLEAGIHDGIPLEYYINDPCPEPSMSKGVVGDIVERCPAIAHYRHPRFGRANGGDSERADHGTAIHSLVLGGASMCIIDAKDWRTNAAKEQREEARAAGMIPILAHDEPALRGAAESAKAALAQFGEGKCEQTMLWQDTGVWCRNRPDFLQAGNRLAVDLKTTDNADPTDWIGKRLVQGGYDVQAALCLRGLDLLLGEAEREYKWLLVELEAPHLCSVVGLGDGLRALAIRKITAARRAWRQCLDSGRWPGYDDGVHWAEPPGWAVWGFESRAISLEAPKP